MTYKSVTQAHNPNVEGSDPSPATKTFFSASEFHKGPEPARLNSLPTSGRSEMREAIPLRPAKVPRAQGQ
jgi:hypothetical protein